MRALPTLAAVLALIAAVPSSAAPAGVEQRLRRVEQLLESRGLLDMLVKVQQLEREVRELRGRLEEQNHAMEEMRARQRNLYVDIDRRLQRLEAGGAPAAPAASPEGTQPPVSAAPQGGAPIQGGASAPASAAGGTTPAAAPIVSDDGRPVYEAALDLLREGRYNDAMKAFLDFLGKYPASAYADNAQYWLGEANYVTRNFDAAVKEFSKVVDDYPDSSKVADALLKRGYVYYEMGRWAEARSSLEKVVKAHPRATAAKLAQQRLERMRKEGR